MGFNHNLFFGLLLFTESMPQQVKESPKHGSAIFQKKIPRPLSATIPLSFFTMLASSLAGLICISLERMSLYSDRIC
jgi:hypothetical protein